MSVCRPFFTGHVDPDALFPFPSMSAEECETFEILRDSLQRFGEERVDSRAIDAEARLPREVLDGLAELGVFGIIVPEEYDGAGASMTFYAKAFETLAGIDGSIVVTVGAHKGPNRLLVKVCVTNTVWGFYLRIGDASGAPLRIGDASGAPAGGLTIEPTNAHALDIAPGNEKIKLPKAPVTPLAAFEQRAAAKKPTGAALADLAKFMRFTGSDDPAERRAKQLAARASS